jgi:hypothetical protein
MGARVSEPLCASSSWFDLLLISRDTPLRRVGRIWWVCEADLPTTKVRAQKIPHFPLSLSPHDALHQRSSSRPVRLSSASLNRLMDTRT